MSWKGNKEGHSAASRGIKVAVTRMIPKVENIEKDNRFVALQDLVINNTITRYGEPTRESTELHEGKYIVDWVKDKQIHLVDADWTSKGEITFHSNKHGHIISKNDLIKLIKVYP